MILYYDNIHICFIHVYIYTHIIYKKCTCLSVPLGRGWVSVQMFMYIGMRRQKLDKMARDLAKKGKGSICLTARENHGPKNWNKWVTQSRTTTKQLPNNYQKNPALLLFPISRRCQFRFASVCQFRREIHWTCQDTLCVIGLKDFKGQNCVDMLLMHLQHELRGSQWQVWDCRGATAKQFAVLWPQHVGHGKVMEASLWGKSHWRPL